ncbi:MAG: TatD family hydrolase [Bacillota bacterium]|nr:TatD family hydrolase [Bacillota bacterium]
MNLVDIGLNLMHKSYDIDREQVVDRALKSEVAAMIITGTSVKSSNEAAEYAKKYPNVLYSTAGVHPHDSKYCKLDTIKSLKSLALRNEVVAIGECGLDFNRDFSPRNLQEKWFDSQIQLACELNMPLFLHERDAHKRFLEVLSNYDGKIKNAVVHCFTGTANELDSYLSKGYYIGITGWICDERRGTNLRELVKRIPLDRLMIETDAPFLVPRDLRPRPADGRNEPAFLGHILKIIAFCMEKTSEEVAKAVTKNSYEFFDIKI